MIEEKTADAILQRSREISIGGVTYNVASPSIGTLILVSELTAKMPKLENAKDQIVVMEVLRVAKDCRVLCDIIATLILGAKFMLSDEKSNKKVIKKLKHDILLDMSPKDASIAVSTILSGLDVDSFFGLTVSLSEVNITKETKETVTTASGQ
jgi:hypothetical protein